MADVIADRFWSKVRFGDWCDCWEWTASLDRDGYGRISAGGTGRSPLAAHRVAYELLVGPIPEGMEIDHLCRNRACVNPLHLEAVTAKVNVERSALAAKTHCKRGHSYTPENTAWRKPSAARPHGYRVCRTCRTDSDARRPPRG